MLIEIIITMSVLAVIGGYIVTSVLLLKFPHILHRKKNIKFKPVHISHRGGMNFFISYLKYSAPQEGSIAATKIRKCGMNVNRTLLRI